MGFAENLARLSLQAADRATLLVQKTALDMGSQVVEQSPVLTGRFKGNWNSSVGAADMSVSDEVDPSGRRTIDRMRSSLTLDNVRRGTKIFISNALPYARKLEYEGHSRQAPNGMVRLTLQRTAEAVKKAVSEIK